MRGSSITDGSSRQSGRDSSRARGHAESTSPVQPAPIPTDPEFDFFFEVLPRLCFQLDPEGRLLRMNSAATKALGYDRQELLHQTILELVHPEDRQRCQDKLAHCPSATRDSVECDLRMLCKDGSILETRTICHGLRAVGDRTFALLIGEEKSDRTDPEEKLAACRECLRRMTSELTRAEEGERRRVAADLHGLVGGGLVAAQLKLGALAAAAPSELRPAVEEIRDRLKSVIDSTRVLTFQISNPLLYEVGLGAALEELLTSLAEEQVLRTEVDWGAEPSLLSEPLRIALYQVLEEVLVDVVKPSRATAVRLSTHRQGDRFNIVLEHDGEGLEAVALDSRSPGSTGLRLLKARQRIASIGGELTIESARGSTRVELSAPVVQDREISPRGTSY